MGKALGLSVWMVDFTRPNSKKVICVSFCLLTPSLFPAFVDYTFAMYPPSMIATGSIGAAVHSLSTLSSNFSGEALTALLASIIGTEVVSMKWEGILV